MSKTTFNIIKITDNFIENPIKPVYILTSLSKEETIGVISALQYYLDTNTRYGRSVMLKREYAIYTLCRIFKSQILQKDEVEYYMEYGTNFSEKCELYEFDMAEAVNIAMTATNLGIYKILEAFSDDEYMSNLSNLYNSRDCEWLIWERSAEDVHYRP